MAKHKKQQNMLWCFLNVLIEECQSNRGNAKQSNDCLLLINEINRLKDIVEENNQSDENTTTIAELREVHEGKIYH